MSTGNRNAEHDGEHEALLNGKVHSSTLPRRARAVIIEPLIFLYGLSHGLILVLQPQYIEQRLAQDKNFTLAKDNIQNGTCEINNSSDPDYITQQEIAAENATWTMINSALNFIPALLIAPYLGVLSDRIGRKLNLAIPIIFRVLSSILFLLIIYFRLPLPVLSFGNLVDGLGGNYCFFMAGCYAYVADITKGKLRLVRLAVVQTVFYASIGITQVPVGYLIDAFGFLIPVWASFAFAFFDLVLLLTPCVLPKTVPQTSETAIGFKDVTWSIYNLFAVNTEARRSRLIIILVIYAFTDIIQLSAGASMIYSLYGLGPPFCWSSITLAFFVVTMSVTSSIALLAGTKLFSLCLREFWILQIAFIFGTASSILYALAPTTEIFFASAVLGSLRGMDGPVLNSMLSTVVSSSEQGTVFAVESSIQSAGNFLAPLILNPIYSATVKTNPGVVFYVMAGVFGIVIILSWIWRYSFRKFEIRKKDTTELGNGK